MWQYYLIAFIVLSTSMLGLMANVHLTKCLIIRTIYGRYVRFQTIWKAVTNAVVLMVFMFAEVPSLSVEHTIYPELIRRIFGAIAGFCSFSNRWSQFFLSFGTCYIAFSPLRPIPSIIYYISTVIPLFFGLLMFFIRVYSFSCSYEFNGEQYSWMYAGDECAQIVQNVSAKVIQILISISCLLNLSTFVKLCYDMNRQKLIEDNLLKARLKKTRGRLAQCVAQDILHILDVTLYIRNPQDYGMVATFLINTYLWNLAHTVDGFIMMFSHKRTRQAFPSSIAASSGVSWTRKSRASVFRKITRPI